MLFEEFFDQGDLEKQEGLPVSMLCDRETTNIAASQPGFIKFVTEPLFQALYNVMPELQQCLDNLRSNSQKWQSYEETKEDKIYYLKKEERDKERGKSAQSEQLDAQKAYDELSQRFSESLKEPAGRNSALSDEFSCSSEEEGKETGDIKVSKV